MASIDDVGCEPKDPQTHTASNGEAQDWERTEQREVTMEDEPELALTESRPAAGVSEEQIEATSDEKPPSVPRKRNTDEPFDGQVCLSLQLDAMLTPPREFLIGRSSKLDRTGVN